MERSSEFGTSEPQVQQGSQMISHCTGIFSKLEWGRGFVKGANGGLLGCCLGCWLLYGGASRENALSCALMCTYDLCIFLLYFDKKLT